MVTGQFINNNLINGTFLRDGFERMHRNTFFIIFILRAHREVRSLVFLKGAKRNILFLIFVEKISVSSDFHQIRLAFGAAGIDRFSFGRNKRNNTSSIYLKRHCVKNHQLFPAECATHEFTHSNVQASAQLPQINSRFQFDCIRRTEEISVLCYICKSSGTYLAQWQFPFAIEHMGN